ncbi:HAD family phosphatase [Bradyrhizobium tropiciagri]|uniref:HAD family hydrolase n=1 Tax=Bradyrhizobium tropiciagri TaxID=312253 RepID=UPI001BA52B05|nr:HAD family phosphatase [Bradyrhizobium tropiciagri]MBR0896767.1 HAD family phosphatase [Bradyrhizobium tropiciagri]
MSIDVSSGSPAARAVPIQGVVFDFGAVLSMTPFETGLLIEQRLDLPKGSISWCGPLDPTLDHLWRGMLAGEISEREYWRRRASEVGRLFGEDWTPRDFYRRVCAALGDDWIRPGMADLLDEIRSHGLKTGVLSNELELFHGPEWVASLEILRKVDAMVDASHTGILKPDSRAYQAIATALDLPLSDLLFVDDQARNVAGARAVGMQAVHFEITNTASAINVIRAAIGDARGGAARRTTTS